jgi:catechol 2,3-dioxygenase-like lactoylglutathione lyase family enzyme
MSDASLFQELTEIGLAVEDLDTALAKFAAVFGDPADIVESSEAGIQMRYSSVGVGGRRINLYQDVSGGKGPVGRSIKRRGEGFFNAIIVVDDLDVAMERMRAAGVEFVEPEPRVFTNGTYNGRRYDRHRIIWTHPASFHGCLLEIQEWDWAPEGQ